MLFQFVYDLSLFLLPVFEFIVYFFVGQLRLAYIQLSTYFLRIGSLSVLRFTKPKLFKPTNDNVCLIFEEPTDDFFLNEERARLETLGPLNQERMMYVHRLHILAESNEMGYMVRHASGCHYECLFQDVVAFLELHPMKFTFYERNKNYSNNFINVVADPKDIQSWTAMFDWKFVENCLQKSKDDGKRQKKNVGFGFTSGMCNSKGNTVNNIGIAEPRMREDTSLPEVKQHFEQLTKFSQSFLLEWMDEESIWVDINHPGRQECYASQISDTNMIEATYYGASSLERSLLRCHTDRRNPCHTKPSLSAVVSLSRRSTLGTRYVIIGAMRKSICNVLEKVNVYERFIKFVVGWCSKLSNGEREYQHSYINCHGLFTFDGFQGYEARAYPCHVDPQSFHMVYRWYVPALARRFRLSYGEVISVATTFDVMAKSHYFFSVVAESLLRANGEWMDTIMNHHRGFAFGYYILVTMHEIKGRTPLPPCRFNDYKSFDLMTYEEWEKVCCNRCRVALHLSASLPSKPEPNKILPSYKKSLNLLKSTVKGAGVLVTNHAIAIMLVLGLLPSWFYSVAVITGDSKYMEYFSNRFDIPKMDNDQATALGERIALLLRDWSNLHINLRTVENLLRKFF